MADCLLKWFNAKFKSNNLELSNRAKRKYEIENPIDWSRDRCICPFPLKIDTTKFDADSWTMSYVNFIIFREHKFLRNIFLSKELAITDNLKDLKTYNQTRVKFLKIITILQNVLNTYEVFSDCFNEDLLKFCCDNCADCSDFNELKETIWSVKVKNNLGFKISKFTLEIHAYVCQKLMDFPSGRFDFDALSTQSLLESVHRVVNVRMHCHHSHVAGKILGYAHDFSNMKVRKSESVFLYYSQLFWIWYVFSAQKNSTFNVRNERPKYWQKWADNH